MIVVEENKDYEEIIGNSNAPYINNVLKKEGANFVQMYGEEHFSQGNYFWMFSGNNQTIGFTDQGSSEQNNPNYPFKTANLGEQLISKGLSFKGYAESLPQIGFTGEKASAGLYARKHVPWISFANVPNGTTVAESSNLRFEDFPSDPSQYDTLPTVAFVIPNLDNDMHNGPVTVSIPAGDRWLQKNIDPYYQWAKNHNSLLILTFDENNNKRAYTGLTNPLVDPRSCAGEGRDHEYCVDLQNRIVTIFAGTTSRSPVITPRAKASHTSTSCAHSRPCTGCPEQELSSPTPPEAALPTTTLSPTSLRPHGSGASDKSVQNHSLKRTARRPFLLPPSAVPSSLAAERAVGRTLTDSAGGIKVLRRL